MPPGPGRNGPQLAGGIHRSGGITGRTEDEAPYQLVGLPLQVVGTHLEPPVGGAGNHDRLGAGKVDDLGVGNPGGRRNQDFVARTEQGEAGVEEGLFGAGADNDVLGRNIPARRKPGEILCDRAAELGESLIGRIAGIAPLNGQDSGLGRRGRGIEVRLANREVEHVLPRCLPAPGFGAGGDGFRTA